MMNWTPKLEGSILVRSDDRRIVFYPLTPFVGFALPKPVFERIIHRFYFRFSVSSAATLLAQVIITLVFNISPDLLLVFGLLDMLIYSYSIRRLTRNMPTLPGRLAFRFYSRWCDQTRLWQRFFSCIFTGAIVGFFVIQGAPGFLGPVVLALLLAGVVLTGFVILVHFRERSLESHEKLRANVPKVGHQADR